MTRTTPIVAMTLALLGGCGEPLPPPAGTTTESTTDVATTTEAPTSSSSDGADETAVASSEGGDESTWGDDYCPPGWPGDTELPPPPVDCSGADGVVMGDVIIDATPGGDGPAFLANVRRIEGSLHISGTSVTDLDFMACVEEVTGGVTIFDNDQLTDVGGLWSLRELGTDFVFSGNDAIVEFQGPPQLVRIVSNLIIRDNASLERIRGFQSLIGLEGYTFVNEEGIEEFAGGNLTIQLNPVLRDIDGLRGLLVLNGAFAVTNNEMLCCGSIGCVVQGIVQPEISTADWCPWAPTDGICCDSSC